LSLPRHLADGTPSKTTRPAAAPLPLQPPSRFPVPAATHSPASLRSTPSPAMQESGYKAPLPQCRRGGTKPAGLGG
jgi:hypothetical protein